MSIFGGLSGVGGGGGYSNTNNPIATGGTATNNSINSIGGGSIGDLNRLLGLTSGPSETGGYTPDYHIPTMRRFDPAAYVPYMLIGGGLFLAWLMFKK